MKRVDDEILSADKERLEELRELDIKTQLSGISFYESVNNEGMLEKGRTVRARRDK